MRKSLQTLQKQKEEAQRKLNKKISDVKAQAKLREKKASVLQQLQKDHPTAASSLQTLAVSKGNIGRPRLENKMVDLHEAILSIVMPEAGADEKRRTEMLHTTKTLDDLRTILSSKGYNLSRTALYYRLVPANTRHIDGKRHFSSVKVKICRPQNNLRKQHADGHVAMASVKCARDLAQLFGEEHVFFLSQDDKARVPIGLPISKKQDVMLMHLDYKVSLPDHDFLIGANHKLIPSVYACCQKKSDGSIGYSGPTYVAIRSGKHDSSCAESHREDFDQLLMLEEFKQHVYQTKGEVKPLIFVSVDGGPDEAPKNNQPLVAWARSFEKYNLDAVFVFTHAPGSSAYNPVERRMAPLSKDTAGIILPFDTFGSHLNASNETIDTELEKKNFQAAGNVLSEVWSETVIDGHPVVAQYKSAPVEKRQPLADGLTEEWKLKHVCQSQYMLQLVKCGDSACCSPFRTNYLEYFPQRFLPPPVPPQSCKDGLAIEVGHFGNLFQALYLSTKFKTTCFDQYCPSLQKKDKKGLTKIQKRTCPYCSKYHSTTKMMNVRAQAGLQTNPNG